MSTGGLYYYKLISPYENDVTKNCKLSINEIDSNFKTLKDADIKSAEFNREDKTLVLTRNDGDVLVVDLSDLTFDLNVVTSETADGVDITISYDGAEGYKEVSLEHLLTAENLKEIIGSEILTKVITDNTLKGDGTIDSPLGLSSIEQTGFYRPVLSVLDLTEGEKLPDVTKLGTRYITAEYISEYGYLYDLSGVEKIQAMLDAEGKGWRVPTKADWDALLNSIEPCEYRDHDSAKCHTELGKVAGAFLKTDCGWRGQAVCACQDTQGQDDCHTIDVDPSDGDGVDMQGYEGVDKYGFSIYPSGYAKENAMGRPEANEYGDTSYFWTTTHVCDDVDQDFYLKKFVWNKGGVIQEAECPEKFFSLRLVKDYDGKNFFNVEYIGGMSYETMLSKSTSQVWLSSNVYNTNGLIGYGEGDDIDYAEVNDGLVNIKRKVYFINEWNGEYWDKKMLVDGDTVVIGTSEHEGKTKYNLEYRVGVDDECNYKLYCTDDAITANVLDVIMPIIDKEKADREAADADLQEQINDEVEARTLADAELDTKIEELSEYAHAKDEELDEKVTSLREDFEAHVEESEEKFAEIEGKIAEVEGKLDQEIADRKAADDALTEALEDEEAARIEADDLLDEKIEGVKEYAEKVHGEIIDYTKEFTMTKDGVEMTSIDGNPEHTVKVFFDGNFGEF